MNNKTHRGIGGILYEGYTVTHIYGSVRGCMCVSILKIGLYCKILKITNNSIL